MAKEVIITNYQNKHLIAYMEDNKAIEMFLKSPESIEIGDVYVGKVKNIVHNIQAAFVEVSPGVIGYYSLTNNKEHLFSGPTRQKLCVGDEILVQIEKGSIKSKAPVLTSKIQLHGKHMVFLGNHSFLGISKKIGLEASRRRLKDIAHKIMASCEHGIIFRTQSEYISEDDLRKEFNELLVDYNNIMSTFSKRTCFSKLYTAPNNWLNFVHAKNVSDIRVLTDVPDIYHTICSDMQEQPLNMVCEYYSDTSYPLIKLKSLETQIQRAISKNVWLKSGASLVIEATEALTAIDVNTSKTEIRKKDEQVFLQINLEAAREIMRQIRLRNLSGIIIADFINLSDPHNEEILLNELKILSKKDPVQTNIIDITQLGLVEITRKRTYRPFYEQLRESDYE